MALIRCSECDGQVSDKAVSCPHCGAPAAVALRKARKHTCDECEGEVEPEATACPHCGAPLDTSSDSSEPPPSEKPEPSARVRHRDRPSRPSEASSSRVSPVTKKYYLLGGIVFAAALGAFAIRALMSSADDPLTANGEDAPSVEEKPPPQHLPGPFSELRIGAPLAELTSKFPAAGNLDACRVHLVGGDDQVAPTVPGAEDKPASRCARAHDVAGLSAEEAELAAKMASDFFGSNSRAVSMALGSVEYIAGQVRGAVRAKTVDEGAVFAASGEVATAYDAVLHASAKLFDGSRQFSKPRSARRPIAAVIQEDCSALDAERVRAYVRGDYSLGTLDGAARRRVANGKCRQPYVSREGDFRREFVRRTGGFAGIGLARATRGEKRLDPDDASTYSVYSMRSKLDAKSAKLGVLLANKLEQTEAFWNGAIAVSSPNDDATSWGMAIVWPSDGKISRVLVNIRKKDDLGSLAEKLENVYGRPDSARGSITTWKLEEGVSATLDIGAAAALVIEAAPSKPRKKKPAEPKPETSADAAPTASALASAEPAVDPVAKEVQGSGTTGLPSPPPPPPVPEPPPPSPEADPYEAPAPPPAGNDGTYDPDGL